MGESTDKSKLEAAITLGFLDESQLRTIEAEQKTSNFSPLEVAIRKGFLNRTQLDDLQAFANPLSIVPGYRIEGLIGRGGVGTVYKANQLRMDRPVAIKIINRAAARSDLSPKRFEREAKIIGQLRHPNIISAIDFGVHHNQLYLVMEFVDGMDAEKYLDEFTSIPERHAWFIARQVCHALDNATQFGVIHRDIKPGNLILTEAPAGSPMPADVPFVKVTDFGLAKFKDQQTDAKITIEQSISGTPFYMSPEQIKALDIDHRSDIYSLGSTIWHLIAGYPPVDGASPLDVITNKMKREDDWLQEAPDEISEAGFRVLAKMCQHDPENRIDDYSVLSAEIDSVIEVLGDEVSQGQESGLASQRSSSGRFSASLKVATINDIEKTYSELEQSVLDSAQDTTNPGQDFHADDFRLTDSGLDANRNSVTRELEIESASGTRRWLPAALALTAVAVLFPFVYYIFPSSPAVDTDSARQGESVSATEEITRPRLAKVVGPPFFLFDGTAVDPTQKFVGTWEAAKGEEGESVLAGLGTRNFICRDGKRETLEYFRFDCGFRHHQADMIRFRLLDAKDQTLFEVDISPEEANLSSGSTEYSAFRMPQFDEESFGYNQFRMESQPDHWRIEVDSELMGEIPKPSGLSGPFTVQLVVEGPGSGHFEQIRFLQLK